MMRVFETQRPGLYNEVIVDAAYWDQHLPDIIEAILMLGNSDEGRARNVHRAFRKSNPARHVPLVSYDHQSQTQPFTLIVD